MGNGMVNLWLVHGCDTVFVDSCVKILPESPFKMIGDFTDHAWSLRICSDINNVLEMGSEPYLYPAPITGARFSSLNMCSGIIIPPTQKRRKSYR